MRAVPHYLNHVSVVTITSHNLTDDKKHKTPLSSGDTGSMITIHHLIGVHGAVTARIAWNSLSVSPFIGGLQEVKGKVDVFTELIEKR